MQKKKKSFSTAAWTTTLTTYFPVFSLIFLSPSVSTVILENVARDGNTGTPTLIFDF